MKKEIVSENNMIEHLVEKAIKWIGFLFLQVMIYTSLLELFTEYDTALNIAWGMATLMTLISTVSKNVRDRIVIVVVLLAYITAAIVFFEILGGMAHMYGIGTGRY